MKILCSFISIILLISALLGSYILKANTVTTIIDSLPPINAFLYSLILIIVGFLSGFFFNQRQIEDLKSSSTKQLRKAEKAGIDTKESLDKIDRLNAKIETLETALQEAIKNKKD